MRRLIWILALFLWGCTRMEPYRDTQTSRDDNVGLDGVATDENDGTDVIDTVDTGDRIDSDSDSVPSPYVLCLDGNGDYLRIDEADAPAVENGFTLELWALVSDEDAYTLPLIRKGDEDTRVSAYFMYARYENDNAMAGLGRGRSSYDKIYWIDEIPQYTWHHYALTYEDATMRFFVDGMAQTSLTMTGADLPPAYTVDGDLVFGAVLHPDKLSFFNGCMDEVRISSMVRYVSDFTPSRQFAPDADTMALWDFSEGPGADYAKDAVSGVVGQLKGDAHIEQWRP